MVQRRNNIRRPRRRAREPRRWPAAIVRFLMHGLVLGLLALLLQTGVGSMLGAALYGDSRPGGAAAGLLAAGQARIPSPRTQVTPVPPASPQKVVSTAATSTPVPASLSRELETYVAGLDGKYGVAVRDLQDVQTVTINTDQVFPTASLYKVLVMYRVYEYIEQKKLSLSGPVTLQAGDLLERDEWDHVAAGDTFTIADAMDRMIASSSNPAAYALARITGGWNPVLATAEKLGMKDTTWDGKDFVTTPADMLHFFEALANRSLVSPKASDEMTAVLLRQKINDRIPGGLPPGTRVAHKTGELEKVRNDAGIVFAPAGPYAIVIMADGVNPVAATKAEARISRIVFDHLGN